MGKWKPWGDYDKYKKEEPPIPKKPEPEKSQDFDLEETWQDKSTKTAPSFVKEPLPSSVDTPPSRPSKIEMEPRIMDSITISSVIGKDTTIKGIISGKEEIRVSGTIEGTINLDSNLMVGNTGVIKANTKAKNVQISGIVQGNILATDQIEIMPTAKIHGDIYTPSIIINEGAELEGRINMKPANIEKALQEFTSGTWTFASEKSDNELLEDRKNPHSKKDKDKIEPQILDLGGEK